MPLDEDILQQVKKILENHKGKHKAIPSHFIAQQVGIDPGPSNVRIRSYITEVVKKQGLPIATAGVKGYYLIENENQLKSYVQSLTGRMQEIQNRIIWVIANYKSFYGSSLDLTGEIIEPDEDSALDDFF